MKTSFRPTLSATLVALAFSGAASLAVADTIKIAYIDPLSGPFAPVGKTA